MKQQREEWLDTAASEPSCGGNFAVHANIISIKEGGDPFQGTALKIECKAI